MMTNMFVFPDVFMVVQVDESVPPPKKHYKYVHISEARKPHINCVLKIVSIRVAFVTKLGVPSYSPFLPVGGSFEKNAALRDFMLTKCIQ